MKSELKTMLTSIDEMSRAPIPNRSLGAQFRYTRHYPFSGAESRSVSRILTLSSHFIMRFRAILGIPAMMTGAWASSDADWIGIELDPFSYHDAELDDLGFLDDSALLEPIPQSEFPTISWAEASTTTVPPVAGTAGSTVPNAVVLVPVYPGSAGNCAWWSSRFPSMKESLKRLRDSASPVTRSVRLTGSPFVESPGVVQELTPAEMIGCLETLIANPRATQHRIAKLMHQHFPCANAVLMRAYWSSMIARLSVPLWFHQFLIDRSLFPDEDQASLAAQAESMSAKLHQPLIQPVSTAVSDWMEFCIKPLLSHPGPVERFYSIERRGPEDEWVTLTEELSIAFMTSELRELEHSLVADGPSGEDRAITVASSAPLSAAPSVVDMVNLGDETSRPSSDLRKGKRLSIEAKWVCVAKMIEEPVFSPQALGAAVAQSVPGTSQEKVINYATALANKARVTMCVHEYLLSRSIDRVDSRVFRDLMHVCSGTATTSVTLVSLDIWVKYCIVPVLANLGPSDNFCTPYTSVKTKGQYMQLSVAQKRAFFADTFAALRG